MEMQNTRVKSYFTRDFILIDLIFFWFCMAKEIIITNFQLIFIEDTLIGLFFSFDRITVILLPIVIVRITSKIGNISPVKISLVVYSILGFLYLLFAETLLLYIFFLPIVNRFINNALNPWIIKKSDKVKLSTVFAFRDFFMYMGISAASFLGLILIKRGKTSHDLIVFSVFTIFLLTMSVLLIQNRSSKKISKEHDPNKIIPLKKFKQITHKHELIVFIIIESLISWIFITSMQLVRILAFLEIDSATIFSYLTLSYLFVALISVLISFLPSKSSVKKKIYLFDLIFDVIPFSIIILSNGLKW